MGVPSSTAFRRSLLASHGVRYDERLSYGVDWDVWVNLARSVRFGYLDAKTCLYRVHQSNMSSTATRSRRN